MMMKRVVLLSLLDTNESSNTPTIIALDKIKERIECNGKKIVSYQWRVLE